MSDKELFFSTLKSVIARAGASYLREGTIPRDILLGLYSILGDIVVRALDIVDRRKVIRARQLGGKKREVFLVTGSNRSKYTVRKHYCTCPAFKFQVVRGSALTCKHLLAVALAESCHLTKQYKITKKEMSKYLKRV